MLEILLVLLLITVIVASIWAISRLAKKIQIYEKHIEELEQYIESVEKQIINVNDRIGVAQSIMKQADIRGAFEADDEVGDAFNIIKEAIDELAAFFEPKK